MLERTEETLALKPDRLVADTAHGTGKFLRWLVDTGITPHIPVWDNSERADGTFSRSDFTFDEERNVYVLSRRAAADDDGQRWRRPHSSISGLQARLRQVPAQTMMLSQKTPSRKVMRDVHEEERGDLKPSSHPEVGASLYIACSAVLAAAPRQSA
jgi:hypothetical protein